MRYAFRSRHLAAALLFVAACGLQGAVQAQTPLISGTAGSGSNTYYFVMDFRAFATPQDYAFTYLSNSTALSFEAILQGLTTVPTFSATIATGSTFGDSLNGLAFAGKTKYNDFNGNNSGEPNGYWSQWNGTNGTTWVEDSLGITNQTISAGQWVGASWTSDYNTVSDAAPRTPFIGGAATPEPGTVALLATGLLGGVTPMVRRRRRA